MSRKSSGCSHCENLTESAHSWSSLSAIMDLLPNEGGDVKPCISIVILCSLYSLRYHMKEDTLNIILMHNLLTSINPELSF